MTAFWVERIRDRYLAIRPAILDGQMCLSFIEKVCAAHGITDYRIVLFHCSDEERIRRLTERGQAHLADTDMMNWAHYLHAAAEKRHGTIIDNTGGSPAASVDELRAVLDA